ncbi:hypothetical protein [Campylobacter helveticus]|uniref:hypothetical protein n=1 Tax=Campylobacter helveticus TaxID=28898 RepID=UPI001112B3D1|nr:hypothetical protein [Campylobacter helveticus]MCR2062552.1 hypothetical protein [Campylobacter helveticus]TNB54454.1 hypothetical protein FDW47_07690 [Campylobacter helveticus]TNB57368.1 hypothetical protein FDW44_07205 [Campylobacter helveticus]
MKKLLILLLCLNSMVFANGTGANTSPNPPGSTTIDEQKKIFVSLNDDVISNGKCTWECRDVKSGYATQIIGFDFKNGTTYCRVYKKEELELDLKFDASRTNLECSKNVKAGLKDEIAKYGNLKPNISTQSSITQNPDNSKITFAKFLVALATLNPQIIDREKTNQQGELTLKDGIENFSISNIKRVNNIEHYSKNFAEYITGGLYQAEKKPFSASGISLQETTAADGFNKNNMAYFSDLFLANEKIYQHLQILIFILVGGFFVSKIGAEKIQAYLENRGESAGKQPYLHKFYIPIIMVGTFFMPIPEANGLAHSTIMQNTIRYFAMKSTEIADMASAIGGKTYMDKIYKSVGGISEIGLTQLLLDKKEKEYIVNNGNEIYKNTCSKRYTEALSSMREGFLSSLSEEDKKEIKEKMSFDINNISGTKKDISLEACITLEVEILRANNRIQVINEKLEGIKKFNNEAELNNRIAGLDAYFAKRELQLGWINSIFTPSSSLLAETLMFNDDRISKTDIKEASKKNKENMREAINKGKVQMVEEDDDITDSNLGWVAGNLVWMMLPGASQIKDFVMDNIKKILSVIGAVAGSAVIPVVGTILGGIGGFIIGAVSSISGYATAILIIQWTFENIPLLVCTTASLIAFVSYLISLIKYFYVSPFVVAFSLATKRMDKIVEFLISGMAIFLKPTLIIIFIYLSLFVHTLINEFFIFASVEQFTGIETNWYNFHTNFIAGSIIGLLKMFGLIASAIIMWKLIISGPSWALSLVGIDGKQDDAISQSMENTLNKRANIV